jgi:ATP-dependent DNA helicase RecG
MDILELWTELIQTDEHRRLEAKPGNEIGNPVMQTVCAYANTEGLHGGYILIGIEEDSNSPGGYVVTGVKNPDKRQNELVTQCTSKFNVIVRPEIDVGVVNNKTVIGVYIPESEPGDKPVYMKKQGMNKGTYIRVGSTDQLCTEDEIFRFIQKKNARPYDETVIPQTSLSDINPKALEEYRKLRKKKTPNAAELNYSDEDLLYALHCSEIIDGIPKPTIAGLILFGTDAVLHRYFSMMRFDYVRVKGREWGGNKNDSVYYSIELRESLLTLLPKAEAAIMEGIEREFSFPQGHLTRDEKPVIPYDVIRELLVNAVMHRDYQAASPVLVIKYTDRIEFHNPGYSLKPLDNIGTPGSTARNQTIASVLHETEYAENKGSGIAKVRRIMDEAQLPPPKFASSETENTFVVTLSLHQLMDENAIRWLSQFSQFGLSSEEARTLVYAKNTGDVSNEYCRSLTGYDTAKSSNLLARMRGLGILHQHSHGSATYYTISEKYSESKPENGLFTQISTQDTQIENENNPKSSLVTQISTQDTQIEERTMLLQSLPKTIQEEILSLGQRMTPEKREEMLVKVCKIRSFTATEVGILFGNTRQWAKIILRELVYSGKIRLTIPETPNSRNQAYFVPQDRGQRNIDEWK